MQKSSGSISVILKFHPDVGTFRQCSDGHSSKPKMFRYIKAVFDCLSHANCSETLPNLLAYYIN